MILISPPNSSSGCELLVCATGRRLFQVLEMFSGRLQVHADQKSWYCGVRANNADVSVRREDVQESGKFRVSNFHVLKKILCD